MGKFLDHHGDTQLFESRNFRRNQSESCGMTVRLLKIVGAESRMLIHLVSKIEIAALLENFPIFRAANLAQQASSFVVRNRLISDGHDIAMRPYFWRLPLADVQIGRTLSHDDVKKLIDVRHFSVAVTFSSVVARRIFDRRARRLLL